MQGFILYEGPSTIDGQPIVAIVTGLGRPSNNVKTGPMAQVYILRADRHPMEAVNTGDDASICGTCRHRGSVEVLKDGKTANRGRSCYVTLMHGPRMVWEAYRKRFYEPLTPAQAKVVLRAHSVRLGAYGDPGAVPEAIWKAALGRTRGLTGYTHLWRRFPYLAAFCMASCDTPAERAEAKALGFRTFRVRAKGEPLSEGEGHCPASVEMGKAARCSSCLLCGGNRRPAKSDITIQVHGTGAKNFAPPQGSLKLN
ncbi:hypothetical protein DA075_06625 [Methylobacterium currus]|uniref:Uncharacterized protein n=1 Tax=Methylobacterium currus TaxID=2051553 RepID=A0A2R4WGI9_9HYPH|nr:hypothetical protein [Methylobacterium currus]AWB20638.1 hypothetical protein DA075_06625 [Methylobacterium currus]